MGDGQLNKIKVGFIIQARMKSTRLPEKVLIPIPIENGKPLIAWITDELKKSKYSNQIIIATSTNKENDILVSFCYENSIACFRGDENDVLSRFIYIAKENKFDCIVRLTGDNPVIDINLLDEAIQYHMENTNDFTYTNQLPLGMNFEIVSPKSLIELENYDLTDADKEHVTLYIKNSENYKREPCKLNIDEVYKHLRLTVDYISDFAMMSIILSQYNSETNIIGLNMVKKLFQSYPWIFETNLNNIQKKQFTNIEEEVLDAYHLLKHFEFGNAANILINNKAVL